MAIEHSSKYQGNHAPAGLKARSSTGVEKMSDSERVFLTSSQAIQLLPDGDRVHTFRNPVPGMMIGADWDRSKIMELLEAHQFELAGEGALWMRHGMCCYTQPDQRLLFIETRENAGELIAQFNPLTLMDDGLAGKLPGIPALKSEC